MEIISQNYENILENLIINNFSEIIKKNNQLNPNENKVFNYIKILDTLDETICNIARKSLITLIESIDRGFKNSPERRHSYHIKAHNTRTIMTIFGEITYRKTIYSHKHSYKSFCFIDDYLGLKKYDYFDPYIKSMIIKYSADNPCTKVAKIINDMIGSRIKIEEPFQYISRQTIRNIILSSPLSNPKIKELETPENLYIMADEKFVSTQNNNNHDVMVKEIVVFDSKTIKNNRTTLNNKYTFAGFKNSVINDCLDYLYYVYDIDKIHKQYVLLGSIIGKTLQDEKYYEKTKNILEEFKNKYNGISIAIGECLNGCPFEMALSFTRYGFKVKAIYATVSDENYIYIKELAKISPDTKVYTNLSPTMLYYDGGMDEVDIAIGADAAYYHSNTASVLWNDEKIPFGYAGLNALLGEMKKALEVCDEETA